MYENVKVEAELEAALSNIRHAMMDATEVRVMSDKRLQRYHAANGMYDYLCDALAHVDKIRCHLAGVL